VRKTWWRCEQVRRLRKILMTEPTRIPVNNKSLWYQLNISENTPVLKEPSHQQVSTRVRCWGEAGRAGGENWELPRSRPRAILWFEKKRKKKKRKRRKMFLKEVLVSNRPSKKNCSPKNQSLSLLVIFSSYLSDIFSAFSCTYVGTKMVVQLLSCFGLFCPGFAPVLHCFVPKGFV